MRDGKKSRNKGNKEGTWKECIKNMEIDDGDKEDGKYIRRNDENKK